MTAIWKWWSWQCGVFGSIETISFSMGCRSHWPDGRMSLEIFSFFASVELNLAFQMTCQPGSIICKYVNLYLSFLF
jgi:hypothetical protein